MCGWMCQFELVGVGRKRRGGGGKTMDGSWLICEEIYHECVHVCAPCVWVCLCVCVYLCACVLVSVCVSECV